MQRKIDNGTRPSTYPFYLLDDDILNLMHLEKIIRNTGLGGEIKKFTSGIELLKLIEETSVTAESTSDTFIIIDNDMPAISGIGFVAKFEQLPVQKKLHYRIFLNTASLSRELIEKPKELPSLIYEFPKPLTAEYVHLMIRIAEEKS